MVRFHPQQGSSLLEMKSSCDPLVPGRIKINITWQCQNNVLLGINPPGWVAQLEGLGGGDDPASMLTGRAVN